MKRVINGVTYNTHTSTKVARTEQVEPEWGGRPEERTGRTLYQTRGGAFFVHTVTETSRRMARGEWQDVERHDCEPLTREQAHEWILEGDVELLADVFGEPPEAAEATTQEATLYARVPMTLKERIETAAGREGLSINSWLIRCAEDCLAARGRAG
jgi:hypothetical protein